MLTEARMDDAAVWSAYATELTRFAASMVGRDDAADAVSTAMVASLSSPGWLTVLNQRAYLYRAVYNQCLRVSRRERQRPLREQAAGRRPVLELPNLRPDVAVAVRELSPQQRAVVVLTYWHDLPVGDVASWLGVSDGSVRKQLARARARLREVLDD